MGDEEGLDVVVDGEKVERGIELVSRSEARGRVLRIRGGGEGEAVAAVAGDVGEGGRNG